MENPVSKTVLITGATSGIGKAIALAFSRQHWTIIFSYHSSVESAKSAVEEFKKAGAPSVLFVPLDLRNNESIEGFYQTVSRNYASISLLINNAGFLVAKEIIETSFQESDDQLQVNLVGLIKLTKLFLPRLTEKIFNIASQYSKETEAGYAVYCASKWGVRGFTKTLAQEVPHLFCLTVNPGPTKTKMNDFFGAEPEDVAELIYAAASGKIKLKSGGDLDVYKMVKLKGK